MWGWSAAQIQLMNIDSPIIKYKREDKKKDSGSDFSKEDMQTKKAKLQKLVADWKKKKASGKGTKLSDWLGEGAKKFDNINNDNDIKKE